MASYPFHFSLLSTLSENTFPDIFFEIQKKEDVDVLRDFSLPEEILSEIRENLELPEKDQEKVLSFPTSLFQAKRIHFFFPKTSELAYDRGEFFRSRKRDFTFVSCDPELEPTLDSLILSTYSYQYYLPDAKKIQTALFRTHETDMEKFDDRLDRLSYVYQTRDMVNTPPSHTRPESVIQKIREFDWKRTKVRIIERAELESLGMNLLLAVSAGSPNPPYVAIFERIDVPENPTYGIVGKGVTFDSGGLQVKPEKAMHDMKLDMAGAATVINMLQYLDSIPNIPVNIIGAVGLVENMSGGNAYKPLDIYRAYNGKTVEIHHTDAEGRLLLADVMSYIESEYTVDHLMTIATLTGACMHALGYNYAGIMGDDEDSIRELQSLSEEGEERVWRLPFHEHLGKSLKTDFADLRNYAGEELAGSSIGGVFLSHFRGNAKYTHIDIAGPSYRESPYGYAPKGASGWGVLLLSEFFMQEKKK